VPEQRSQGGESRSLTVSTPADPQVSQSAGDGTTAPQASQADSVLPSAAAWTPAAASPARIDGDLTHEASTSRSRGGTSTLTVNGMNYRPCTITRGQGSSLTRQ
jgi:hypothetical protein